MFNRMNTERRRIMSNIVTLVYFMRGSIQYNDMYEMTKVEREAVNDFIEERLDKESKKMNPQY